MESQALVQNDAVVLGLLALILGFVMTSLVRSRWAKLLWTLWPSWVWFSVMATANHFWLDIAAGIGLAAISISVVTALEGTSPLRRLAVAPFTRRRS
jgi:vacuolar-type H+-ATPase subunit I/STV1